MVCGCGYVIFFGCFLNCEWFGCELGDYFCKFIVFWVCSEDVVSEWY